MSNPFKTLLGVIVGFFIKIAKAGLGKEVDIKTSNTANEIMSLEEIRRKYGLFSQVVKINIENLQRFDKERKEILARFTAGTNKAYHAKEKRVGDETEQAVMEICQDLMAFVSSFYKDFKSKKVQMDPEEAKQISGEFDRCEDILRKISWDYAETSYYKRLEKGNSPFSLDIWGLQLANNTLRDLFKPSPPKKESRSKSAGGGDWLDEEKYIR